MEAQVSLFPVTAHHDITLSNTIIEKPFDYNKALQRHAFKSQQYGLLPKIDSDITVYRSGASSIADMQGYTNANVPIGVCVGDLSENAKSALMNYCGVTGLCMIDSGAFGLFNARQRGQNLPDLDFEKILSVYENMASQCDNPKNIIVVAPDVVGEQGVSFALLKQYNVRLQLLMKLGVNIMIPLQKGQLTINDCYDAVVNLFGKAFVCGLPFNAKALSESETLSFVSEKQPIAVHFLGCSENEIIHKAKTLSPDTQFSCDATRLRAHIGKNRLLTEMQNQKTDEQLRNALHGIPIPEIGTKEEFDETEVLGNLTSIIEAFSQSQLRTFAKQLNTTSKALKEAINDERVWDHLDEVNYGFAEHYVGAYFESICRKKLSSAYRTHTVKVLAQMEII